MRRHYVASTLVRRHVPARNVPPPRLAAQYSKPCPPPNILNRPTPMFLMSSLYTVKPVLSKLSREGPTLITLRRCLFYTSRFTLKIILWDMTFWPFKTGFCIYDCFDCTELSIRLAFREVFGLNPVCLVR